MNSIIFIFHIFVTLTNHKIALLISFVEIEIRNGVLYTYVYSQCFTAMLVYLLSKIVNLSVFQIDLFLLLTLL